MYLLPTKNPYAKIKSTVSNINYVITFTYDNPETSLTIRNQAKILVEHMTIIEESRKLIKKGKSMSWQEFTENESK